MFFGKSAHHVYIQGCAAKLVKAGKCVLGIKELPNQRLLKMLEGNNFGAVKRFIHISFPLTFHSLGVENISQRKKNLGRAYMMSYKKSICAISEGDLVTSFSQYSQGNVVSQD